MKTLTLCCLACALSAPLFCQGVPLAATSRKPSFPPPEVQAVLTQFVPVALMIQDRQREGNKDAKEVAKRYGVRSLPTLLILNEEGRELKRYVGGFSSLKKGVNCLKKRER